MILPAARIQTPKGVTGSGFILSQGANGTFVLTNHHVVSGAIQQSDRWDPVAKSSSKVERTQPISVQVFRYDDRGRHVQTVTTSAQIVGYSQYGDEWDFEGDLALLKLQVNLDDLPHSALIGEREFMDEVRTLDEIVMVGCPDGSELPLPTTGHIASLTEERAGVSLLLSQVFGNQGSSGSAVYRFSPERGAYEVIAIHSMVDSRGSITGATRGSFLRLAIPAPAIRGFLCKAGFEGLVEPPGQAPAASDSGNASSAADAGDAPTSDGGSSTPSADDGNASSSADDGNATAAVNDSDAAPGT